MNEESINYSLRNLRHRKGRSFLTIFSILVGIATIFIFISFGYGLYNYTESFTTGSSADKLLIMAKGAGIPGMDDSFVIDESDLEIIQRTSGVYGATGAYFEVVEIEKGSEIKSTFIVSYDPKIPLLLDIFQVGAEKGRFLRSGDKGVVLGYNFLIDGKIFEKGLDVNDVIEINGEKFQIIGFMESVGNPQDDSQIYITNEEFLDLFPDKESYAEIVARVDLEEIDKVVENIEKALRKHRNLEEGKEDFFVQSFEDMIESYSGALDVVVGFVILIALISVLVSGVNTANTMITSVLERYKEIGILKSIGARNSDIFWIFLFESAFLGFVAGSLGVLIGFGLTELGGAILTSLGGGFLQPYYSFWIFAGCILFATLTGAISGVIPAYRASKINPVDALRYE
jgi:putative ABC transport system permease protein